MHRLSPSSESAGRSRRDLLSGRLLKSANDADNTKGSRETATEGLLYQVSRRAMACDFEVSLPLDSGPDRTASVMSALDTVEQLDQQLSVYRHDSELSQLNQTAAKRNVPVTAELWQLLSQCIEFWEQTAGAFDITSTPLSRCWGFFRRQGQLASQAEISRALESVGSQWLILDDKQHTVRFDHPQLELNLGSIGKGHALDRAALTLQLDDCHDFIIHGGYSSILARGNRRPDSPQGGWQIGVRHPTRPQQRLLEVTLQDQSAGTSGSANQFFHHEGRRYSHILDPRTGWPSGDLLSATVIAPSAATSDALATALFVMGLDKSLEFLASQDKLAAILIRETDKQGSTQVHLWGLPQHAWSPVSDNFDIVDHCSPTDEPVTDGK